jgi:hypothetical protein
VTTLAAHRSSAANKAETGDGLQEDVSRALIAQLGDDSADLAISDAALSLEELCSQKNGRQAGSAARYVPALQILVLEDYGIIPRVLFPTSADPCRFHVEGTAGDFSSLASVVAWMMPPGGVLGTRLRCAQRQGGSCRCSCCTVSTHAPSIFP